MVKNNTDLPCEILFKWYSFKENYEPSALIMLWFWKFSNFWMKVNVSIPPCYDISEFLVHYSMSIFKLIREILNLVN